MIGLLITLTLVLQTVLLPMLGVPWLRPDLLLCLVVAIAQCDGYFSAAYAGLVGGALLDICFGTIMGYNAFLYMLTAFVAGYRFRPHGNVNVVAAAILTLLFAIGKELLGMGIVWLSGVPFLLGRVFAGAILPGWGLTFAMAFPVYAVVFRTYLIPFMRRGLRHRDLI